MKISQTQALLLCVVIAACGRAADLSQMDITGSWSWAYGDDGSLGGMTEALGSGCVLEVEADQRFRFQCAADHVMGSYAIGETAIAVQTQERGPLITFSEELPVLRESSWVVRAVGDTLFLRTLAYDDFDHAFVRTAAH